MTSEVQLLFYAYVLGMPIAILASQEIWPGTAPNWERRLFALTWPLCAAIFWLAICIYFPLHWLRIAIFRGFKPLHDKGYLPKRAVGAINWLLRRLPD